MSIDIEDIRAEVRRLPLTHNNLCAVVCMAAQFAHAMHTQGGVTGADDVSELLTEAFSKCDDVFAVTLEDRNERALSRMVDERYGI